MRLPLLITAVLALASLALSAPTPEALRASMAAADPTTTAPPPSFPSGLTLPTTTAPLYATPGPTLPIAPPPAVVQSLPATVLPFGKGMWLWQPDQVEGGDAAAIVSRAKSVGLTHLYVRTGSSWDGFYAQDFLNALLPVAHANGIRVYGWDFPNFRDVGADISRSVEAIAYTTPDGHRIDGFSSDMESPSEGVDMTPENALAFGAGLRAAVGPLVPLIATVPRPSEWNQGVYPFVEATAAFDAVAPMIYWLNRQPDSDVQYALEWLQQLGKPIMPVGQAYDGAREGGRPGPPSPDEIARFLMASQTMGATAVSFWSWQHASVDVWDTIQTAPQYSIVGAPPKDVAPVTMAPPLG